MDKKLKTKWVKALRSGKYRQYRDGALKFTDEKGRSSYCCLGVLCEIANIRSGNQSHIRGNKGPENRRSWRVLPETVQIDLADMNDDGKTFRTIANWIERNVEVSRR